MDSFWQDVRYAIRMLLKSLGFSLLAIITLALGIGANTAIFSVIYAVLLKPLPYPQPDKIALLREKMRIFDSGSLSYPNYMDWRAQQRSFTDLALFRNAGINISAQGEGEPERVRSLQATYNLLAILGVKPELGRDFAEVEDKPGAPHLALISYQLWQRRFGGKPNVLGQRLTMNGVPTEIIGVLPRKMDLQRTQVIVPLGDLRGDPDVLERGNHPGFSALGRLKDGITWGQSRADLDTIAQHLEQKYPDSNMDRRVTIRSLLESSVGDYRSSLYVLLGAVACVLLIACANVAGLLLARGTARQRELGVRAALGASRLRLTRQLVTESFLLAFVGAAAGVLLAVWGLDLIVALRPPDSTRFQEIGINAPAMIFTTVIASLAGLLAGAWPAWRIAGAAAPSAALREGGRGSSDGADRQRLRAGLVVAQVALALVLLSGAGLLLKSFWQIQHVPLGFNPDRVLAMTVALPTARYDADAKIVQFYDQLLERVRALPGVVSVAAGKNIPFDLEEWDSSFHLTGHAPDPPGKEPSAEVSVVSPDYFRALGIPLLRGRSFGPADVPGKKWSIIIDESFAKRFFPNQNPIGQHVDHNQTLDKKAPPLTIVGVVGRTCNDDPSGELTKLKLPQMYFYTTQNAETTQMLIVRVASGDPLRLAPMIKRVVQEIDPDQPLSQITTMQQLVTDNLASRRLTMTLVAVFAGLALTLAAVGLFGVMALRVTQRTREIGIRMALGAQRADVFRIVIESGLKLAAAGVILGIIASLAVTRTLAGLLFGVNTADPFTLIFVVLLLGGVTLLANYLPARKATKVNPIVALREE